MKAVIQRCRSASVTVDGVIISQISRGLLVLVGIGTNDTTHDSSWLATKLLNLRLFPEDSNDAWGWKKSVMQIEDGQVLCVSQFTLMANTKKGSKPDFHGAMPGESSKQLYEEFLADLRSKYSADKIKDGQFGAMMDVQLVNDGPATIILDSKIDAPAPPAVKVSLTPEQKQQRNLDLAEKAKRNAEFAALKNSPANGKEEENDLTEKL